MKPEFINAVLGTRVAQKSLQVRITGSGCVSDRDVPQLRKARSFKFFVEGAGKEREFCKLRLGRQELLADIVTGTVYRAEDGMCLSSSSLQLRIHQ